MPRREAQGKQRHEVGRAAQTASEGCDWSKLRETKGTQKVEEAWRQRADDQGSAMPKIFGRTREKFEETHELCLAQGEKKV
jgi:hypothetical protein